jgi:hypothetical protein
MAKNKDAGQGTKQVWNAATTFATAALGTGAKVTEEALGAAEDVAGLVHDSTSVARLATRALAGEYFTDERIAQAKSGGNAITKGRECF